MTWYYALANERQGPIDDATLDGLIAAGTVTPDTLVWRAGMTDWQPLAQARPRVTPVPARSCRLRRPPSRRRRLRSIRRRSPASGHRP